MAGGYGLFVDNGTNVKTFCHAHIIDVLNHGDGLSHAQTLGGKTGQNVGLGIACERHECLGVLDAFFNQQGQIPTVSIDDHYLVVVDHLVDVFTAFLVYFDNLRTHVVGQGQGSP